MILRSFAVICDDYYIDHSALNILYDALVAAYGTTACSLPSQQTGLITYYDANLLATQVISYTTENVCLPCAFWSAMCNISDTR